MQSIARNGHPSTWCPRSIVINLGFRERVFLLLATDSPLLVVLLQNPSSNNDRVDITVCYKNLPEQAKVRLVCKYVLLTHAPNTLLLLLLSHCRCRPPRHHSRAARPGIPAYGHTQDSLRIAAPIPEVHRRRRQIVGGLPS